MVGSVASACNSSRDAKVNRCEGMPCNQSLKCQSKCIDGICTSEVGLMSTHNIIFYLTVIIFVVALLIVLVAFFLNKRVRFHR